MIMNVVYYDKETKLVNALVYNPTELPTEADGIAVGNYDFPTVQVGNAQLVNYYFDSSTKTFTYKIIDRQLTPEEISQQQLNSLGQQLAQEKLTNIQNTNIITGLGQQVADLKLQIIKLQGGTK
jgi:hypothetical protein